MKKFNVNNKVHEIEEGFEHLLPDGSVEITDEEATLLLTPVPLTAQETEDNLVVQSLKLDQPVKAFAAVLEQLWDNSLELQTAFPNPGGYSKMQQDAIARYKAKL